MGLHYNFLFYRELHCDYIFSMELHYSLVYPVLENIPETPSRISIVIPRVVILIVDFYSKLLFVGELVILRKSDEILLHKGFLLSLCHIKCILGLCIRGL